MAIARIWRSAFALLLLPAFGAPAAAQIRDRYGDIAGTVTDPSGRRIPGAALNVSDMERGFRRAAKAGGIGEFRVALLPPGRYTVRFEAAGFTPLIVEGVEVRVGESVEVNGAMSIKEAESSITVPARAPAVETTRVHQANWLETERIDSLPINRRNYLDFALLAPGVVETITIADGADYRVPSVPHSGLGIGGNDGSGNTFAIDGFNNSGITGNMRPSVPQSAVQEFQINRNSYTAEFGGGFGGAINIVTRSGTGNLHAEVFGYLRHRDIQARNFFDPGKAAFTRVQSGASAGGPLRRERTFWFAAVERLDRHESVFVPILSDPGILSRLTASQQQLLSFLDRSGVLLYQALSAGLHVALTPTANPLVQPLFAANSGVFPSNGGATQSVLRIDHRFSDRDSLFARANVTWDTAQNTKFGAQAGFSRGSRIEYADNTNAVQYTHVFSPRWLSDTRASFAYSRFTGEPNDPAGPAIDVTGYGSFGRDPQFPADTRVRQLQFQQFFTRISGRHALKFGADINPSRNTVGPQVYMGGRFIFGSFIPLGEMLNQASGNPGFAAGMAAGLAELGQPGLARALNEPITSLQAFALGLPVGYLQSFGNPKLIGWQQHYSFFVEDTFRPRPGLTLSVGLRNQTDVTVHLPGANNFSPRFGVAWSPVPGGNFVIRTGYGLFQAFSGFEVPYAGWSAERPDLTFAFIPITGISVINPQTRKPLNSVDIYQGLLAQGVIGSRGIRFQDLAQFGVPAGFRFPNAGGIGPNFENPYSHQAGLEVEHSIAGFTASAAYSFSRTLHLPRIRDVNLYQAGVRPDGWPVFGKVDPSLDFKHWVESAANASYSAMILQLSRRFRRNWTLHAHYTLSRTIDEVTDLTPDYTPHNQLDARGDRSLSAYHQKHRVVGNAVFQSPAAVHSPLLKDWTLSTIVQANSARPFNVLTGFDNLGDGKITSHRPLGLGRYMGVGPDLFSLDLRVMRTLWLSRDRGLRLQFTAEAFNTLNRTNFESVNNVVGDLPLSALPNPITGRRGDPAQPFSFTSAHDPRQFQFGARLAF